MRIQIKYLATLISVIVFFVLSMRPKFITFDRRFAVENFILYFFKAVHSAQK